MSNQKESYKNETLEDKNRTGNDSDIQPVYSDIANVIFSQEEVVLMFGKTQRSSSLGENRAVLTNSITLNPYNTKRLALLLGHVIKEYETKLGPINPRSSSPGERPSGKQVTVSAVPIILKDLDVPVDAERSFKMFSGHFITNRYLLGVNKESLGADALEKVKSVCMRMNMDEDFFRTFEQYFPDGDYVHFGFEENEKDCVNKVYLEFYEKIKKEREGQRANKEPVLLHLGFKWDSSDSSRRVISKYTWFPLISVSEMNERISGIIPSREDNRVLKSVTGIIAAATSRCNNIEILYQEVTEEGNPRKSFDINIYRSGLKICELYSFLLELSRHYRISLDLFHSYYRPIKEEMFGHISGGINREGKSFVTIYYGVEGVESPGDILLINNENKRTEAIDVRGEEVSERKEDFDVVKKIGPNAKLMFNLVSQLDVQVGFERSFKLVKNQLLEDRFLMGFRRDSLSPERYGNILDICRQLNMPDDFQKSFASNMNDASIILFGFEGNEETLLYKVYLEFGDRIKCLSNIDPVNPPPVQIHFGYKWDVFENSRKTTTEYTCFPSLEYNSMLKRLQNIFPDDKQKSILDVTTGITNMARCRIDMGEFLYIEAKDDDNSRLSFDINVYTADLRMWELYPFLLKTMDYYSIPLEKFHGIYSEACSLKFGHVTGGIDRKGRDFLTFYFGKKGSSGKVAGI